MKFPLIKLRVRLSPGLQYFLGRLGIFVACVIPALVFFPGVNPLLKLLVAFAVSAALSFFLLRQWRDELAEQMSANAWRRIHERERLRSALAGDDESPIRPVDEDEPLIGPPGEEQPKTPDDDERPPKD
jgi:hypothetical protein